MKIDMDGFFDKYENIELFHIDQMLHACAAGAVWFTATKWKGSRGRNSQVKCSAKYVTMLLECYKESDFAHGLGDDYKARVQNEFTDIAENLLPWCCADQTHYNLILPVVFFHLIMINEFNNDSSRNRQAKNTLRKEKGQEYIKWISQFERKVQTIPLYQEKRHKDKFSTYIQNKQTRAESKNYLSNDLLPESIRTIASEMFTLKDKYADIKRFSEYSKVGVFLYDLLSTASAWESETELDTLLRLYMVAQIHDVLGCTRHIIAGKGYSATRGEVKPLLHYYDKVLQGQAKQSNANISPFIPCVDKSAKKIEKILGMRIAKKNTYAEYYQYLSRTYSFNSIRKEDILKFYLDPDILSQCVDADVQIKEFLSKFNKLLQITPQLKDAAALASTVDRIRNLFDADRQERFWKESAEYHAAQEVSEMLAEEECITLIQKGYQLKKDESGYRLVLSTEED